MLVRLGHRAFSSLKELYLQTVRREAMQTDPKQLEVVSHLERLKNQLQRTHPNWKRHIDNLSADQPQNTPKEKEDPKPKNNKFFSSLFRGQFSTLSLGFHVQGMYLFGGSGCGKSFLSDLFYSNLTIKEKQRLHFHEFMGGVHAELFQLQRSKRGFDPLVTVATRRAKQLRLLYLDEFQVTDVADASILKRLFEQLLGKGMVLLATSNRHPTDLYKGGHQREFFLPFIDLLQQKCSIVRLGSHDYRLSLQRSTDSQDTTYIYPNTPQNQARFVKVFSLVAEAPQAFQFLSVRLEPVKGRSLVVQRAFNRVCIFEFEELLEAIMGDVDFRAICKNFRAIFINNFRPIGAHERNLANRLIKLFDEAYFRHVKVYLLGSHPLEQLLTVPQHPRNEQQFAMVRCHSRLIEFQTKAYRGNLSFCELPENISIEEGDQDGSKGPQ